MKKVQINIVMDVAIHDKLIELARKNDVSLAFVLRRALVRTVEDGRVYWPADPTIERREREKFGEEATPVYDSESEAPVKDAKAGRKAPAPRAQ